MLQKLLLHALYPYMFLHETIYIYYYLYIFCNFSNKIIIIIVIVLNISILEMLQKCYKIVTNFNNVTK